MGGIIVLLFVLFVVCSFFCFVPFIFVGTLWRSYLFAARSSQLRPRVLEGFLKEVEQLTPESGIAVTVISVLTYIGEHSHQEEDT